MPAEPDHKPPRPISRVLLPLVVLGYAAIAGLWIVLSDKILVKLFEQPAILVAASTLKGLLFVAITSLLLYLLMRRMGAPVPDVSLPPPVSLRPGLPFLLLVAAILAMTLLAIGDAFSHQRSRGIAQLQIVAKLKSGEVSLWLAEKRGIAEYFSGSTFFRDNYLRWKKTGDARYADQLQERMDQLREHMSFAGVTLTDGEGRPLIGSDMSRAPGYTEREACCEAARDRKVHIDGPYLDAAGNPQLEIIAPLAGVPGLPPLVVFRTRVEDMLPYFLQRWPVPSASGEALLVRRDGDHLEYLNELRFRKHSMLALPVALTQKDVLAVQAVTGAQPPGAVLEGVDYRGVPVLGIYTPIPGTDWFLIAKMDRTEVNRDALQHAVWIAMAGAMALFMAMAGLHLSRQRMQAELAAGIRQNELQQMRRLQLLQTISDNSGDAVFAKDLLGRYILFNKAAGNFVGQPPEQVLGHDDHALFPPEQAVQLMALDRKVVAENRLSTQEEYLDTPGGKRVFLSSKGPLRDPEGKIIGSFGIARDMTHLRQTEQALRLSDERLRLAQASASIGSWEWQLASGKVMWSAELERQFGYAEGTFPGTYAGFSERVLPEDLAELERVRDAAVEAHAQFDFDFRVRRPDGETRWLNCKGAAGYDGQGRPERVFGATIDITERKRNETALRHEYQQNRHYLDTVQTLMVALDAGGCITMINRYGCKLLGYEENELIGRNWFETCLPRPEAMEQVYPAFRRLMAGDLRAVEYLENAVLCRDGRLRTIAWHNSCLTDDQGSITGCLSSGEDVTERRMHEAALHRQAEELRNYVAELERFNRATLGRELDMIALKRQVNALSLQLGLAPPYDLTAIEAALQPPEPQ